VNALFNRWFVIDFQVAEPQMLQVATRLHLRQKSCDIDRERRHIAGIKTFEEHFEYWRG